MSTDADSPIPPRIRTDAARVALVERDRAWKLAALAIGRAHGGRGAALVYHGAPGIGKSGLMAAIRSLAAESGTRVLTATGRRRETEFGFGVVLQLLESGLDAPESDGTSEWLARLTGSTASLAQLHGLYRVFRDSAAVSPASLIIDDADVADEPSLKLVLYLIERMADLPLALILAAGTVSPRLAPPLLLDIARHPLTTRCRLEPLSETGTARRVAKTWLPGTIDEAAGEIHRATEGNAFLVDSLAATVAARNGDPTPVAELAPRGVADWASARAAELDSRAPALLDAVAVVGQNCELRHAAALASLDPETAAEIADGLRDAALLAPGDRLTFCHTVVATAIEAALPRGARSFGHLHAARLLAAESASAERVGEHLLSGARTGSRWTVDALRAAAVAALRRAAPSDAVRYLRRALEEPPTYGERAQVMLDLGRAEAMAGEPQAAVRLRQAAESLTQAPEQPRAAITTGRTLFALGRPEQALAVFERGLANAADADADIVGQLRAGQATAAWLTAFADHGGQQLLAPPARADTPGDRGLVALHAIDAALRGRPCAEVRVLAERALAGGALLADETADGLSYYLATGALALAGELEGAEAALTAAYDDARSRGSVLGLATASQLRATVILMRGRLLDAAVEAGRALAFADYGCQLGVSNARVVRATTLLERGDLEGSRGELEAAEAASGERDPFKLSLLDTRGRLRLSSGRAKDALADFLACGELAYGTELANPALVPWRSHAGLALAAMGDSSEAERLAEKELQLANTFGAPGPVGRALRALALIREPALAPEALEAAVEALERSQAELEYAGALVDLGAALRRSGKRRAAREPLMEGLELAQGCGAELLATRALQEMRLAGARPRRTALRGREALTVREHEVATLAADGLSNRRIAETLVVTLKTVEWHLNHCYRKLGVRSRRELRELLGHPESTPAIR